jgi:hypothetical protein
MPVLNPNSTVVMQGGTKGRTLTITAPASNQIADFPTVNGVSIPLSAVPKNVTIPMNSNWNFISRAVAITYTLQ